MNRLLIPAIAITAYVLARLVMRLAGELWTALEAGETSPDQHAH